MPSPFSGQEVNLSGTNTVYKLSRENVLLMDNITVNVIEVLLISVILCTPQSWFYWGCLWKPSGLMNLGIVGWGGLYLKKWSLFI